MTQKENKDKYTLPDGTNAENKSNAGYYKGLTQEKNKKCEHRRNPQHPKCLHCLDCSYEECVDEDLDDSIPTLGGALMPTPPQESLEETKMQKIERIYGKEEEFEETKQRSKSLENKFGNLLDRLGIFLDFDHKEEIMSFISNFLSSEKLKWEKKAREYPLINSESYLKGKCDGYNQARTQLLSELREKMPNKKVPMTPTFGQVAGYNQALEDIDFIIKEIEHEN